MSTALTYQAIATVVETPAGNGSAFVKATDATVTLDGMNTTVVLGAATTPPVSKSALFTATLVAGTVNIDLTALVGLGGGAQDCTGLRVQLARFKAPAGNANPITIQGGDTNSYDLMGSTFKTILQPGQEVTFYGCNLAPVVGSGAKTMKLTGTGSQTLQVEIVAG